MRSKSNLSNCLWCLLLLTVFCPAATGEIIYIDDDAIGANDGSSWENAYTYLQDALTVIKSTEVNEPIEIHVAQGTYKPNQGLIPIIPEGIGRGGLPYPATYPADEGIWATFNLINGVTIKGGYASIGTPDPNARDIELYKTILSGNLSGNDIDVNEPTLMFHSHHIIVGSNTDETAVLDGFTITGGRISVISSVGRGSGGSPSGGAGMLIFSGSPTLIDCTFTDNVTCNTGGGLLIFNGSPKIENCTIAGNQAYSGGAIAAINSSVRIIDCIIRENIATNGGGIFCEDGGAVIEQCLIEKNRSVFGGGIVCSSTDRDVLVLNCIVKANTAESSGGGLICGNGTNVSGCLIVGNSAAGKVEYYNGAWPSRALRGGGGVALYGEGAVLNNCTISENAATNGSGILTGCRFDYLDWAFIYNSIIWNNSGGDQNQVVISPCCPMCVRIIAPVGLQAHYCCIQGTPSVPEQWPYSLNDTFTEYINCIDVEPLFAYPGYWDPNGTPEDSNDDFWVEGDYHLKSQAGRWDPDSGSWVIDDVTSPCIDAGDPNTPVGDEPLPNGGIINMGAYGGTAEASKSFKYR